MHLGGSQARRACPVPGNPIPTNTCTALPGSAASRLTSTEQQQNKPSVHAALQLSVCPRQLENTKRHYGSWKAGLESCTVSSSALAGVTRRLCYHACGVHEETNPRYRINHLAQAWRHYWGWDSNQGTRLQRRCPIHASQVGLTHTPPYLGTSPREEPEFSLRLENRDASLPRSLGGTDWQNYFSLLTAHQRPLQHSQQCQDVRGESRPFFPSHKRA